MVRLHGDPQRAGFPKMRALFFRRGSHNKDLYWFTVFAESAMLIRLVKFQGWDWMLRV